MKYLALNDINCYKRSLNISNYVWNIVVNWEWFSKKTVGDQFVRAVDSVSANIAEGFGRYTKKDKIKFYRYSFGSLKESCDWNEKAKIRKLITMEQYAFILNELQSLPKEINQLIQFTNLKLKK
ncbi:MAG TPA: four helix bundle protein [Alphaproteobacteria bacterium]|jgi:four helix bundle protein|nr:four helix bundle protein [Alphaproteobacteria bacterium]